MADVGPQTPSEGAFIKDVTEASFLTEVLDRSVQVPVVVDFWAPWCGPCRTLTPLLEREITALKGRVELAKVNTDENPVLASQFAIQSIPNVKAFHRKALVGEFLGVRSPDFIRTFLTQLVPSQAVEDLAQARQALRAGDRPAAQPKLEGLLEDPEVGAEAALLLAHLYFDEGRFDDMKPLFARVETSGAVVDRADPLRELLALPAAVQAFGGTDRALKALAGEGPHPPEVQFAAGAAQALQGRWVESLDTLLDLVARKPRWNDGAAKRAMVALFDHLGTDHPLTAEYRRRLQIVS